MSQSEFQFSPLSRATITELYGRWAQIGTESEEDQAEVAWYIASKARQDELRQFVMDEIGESVRRVFINEIDADRGVADPAPGWLYLDYGITLVPSVPHDQPLPIGGMRRDQVLDWIRLLHRHFPDPPSTYLFAFLIYNGNPSDVENLLGVGIVGAPGPHSAKIERAGTGPRLANVTRLALNHSLPREVTMRASSAFYDAAAEEAYRRGFDFLETYTLVTEHGRSLRYSKWISPNAPSNTKGKWRRVGWARPRTESRRGKERTEAQAGAKWRWWKQLSGVWKIPGKPKEGSRKKMVIERRNPDPPGFVQYVKIRMNGSLWARNDPRPWVVILTDNGYAPQTRAKLISRWGTPQAAIKVGTKLAESMGIEVDLPREHRQNPPPYTEEEYTVYISWVLYAVLGELPAADFLMQKHGGLIRTMASKLRRILGVSKQPIYRGMLLDYSELYSDNTVAANAGYTFMSFSEDKGVACWFADRDAKISRVVAAMRPEAVGWITQAAQDDEVLFHWRWAEKFPRPDGRGIIPLWELAKAHPDIDPMQFKWNVQTQKEVIVRNAGKPLKLVRHDKAGCAPTAELDARLGHPRLMNPPTRRPGGRGE